MPSDHLFYAVQTQISEATQKARASWNVALVSMPFVSMDRPSIQIGLLKAIATSYGFPASAFNLNLDFARQIGPELYDALCQYRGHLLGDWLFSLAAFGDDAPDPDDQFLETYYAEIAPLLNVTSVSFDCLRQIRHVEVTRYLDHLIDSIAWERFRLVGFTSTFQQNTASFALAKYIKRRFPDICILFGGANFEDDMGLELVRTTQCIDYAVIGEGDKAFPAFLIALQEGRDPAEVPGVVCRRNGEVTPPHLQAPFSHMDETFIPDYTEFFERAESLDLLPVAARRVVDIPFESSRGCWWGQKHHCTFCGLNGMTMPFRAKSPDRIIHELSELSKRYRSFQFEAVDNIVDMSYLKQLFPRLSERATDFQFFYEVKSNLSREKIKILSQGGVKRIQPGIESLSSHVLKLMNKGVTAIHNVNTLRWALYYDITVNWNMIWGFPGETVDDYREQLLLLRHLIHLQPPGSAGRIWMERFSPIFFNRQAFPARYIHPEPSYEYIYPHYVQLNKVAYFFDYELENTLPDSAYEETLRRVQIWQNAWKETMCPTLTYWSAPNFLQIEDARNLAAPGTFTFLDPLASLYVACSEHPRTASELKQQLTLHKSIDEIEMALDEFCIRGLMMREESAFLSLALPATTGR